MITVFVVLLLCFTPGNSSSFSFADLYRYSSNVVRFRGYLEFLGTSILKRCIRFSTLRPLELISTLLGRAYSLCQLEVSPRRKLGK